MSPIVTMQRARCGPGLFTGVDWNNFTPNLPGGLTEYTDDQFSGIYAFAPPDYSAQKIGGFYLPGGLTYTSGTPLTGIVTPYGTTALQVPFTGSHGGEQYPSAGAPTAYGGGGFLSTYQRWTRLYWSMALWVSSDYVVHSNPGTEKFFYAIFDCDGYQDDGGGAASSDLGFTWDTVNYGSAATGCVAPYFGFAMSTHQGGANVQYAHTNWDHAVLKGEWNIVEAYLTMNTPNNPDGTLKVWITNSGGSGLACDWSGMQFVKGGTAPLSQAPSANTVQSTVRYLRFTGTRGGGASSVLTPSGGQERRYGRIYAAGIPTV